MTTYKASDADPVVVDPFQVIVEVGWSGRFGFVNITELDGGHDLTVPFAAESPGPFVVPPVFGAVRGVGDVIDLAPWNSDSTLDGVLSIDVTGAAFHGQVVNFRRLEQGGGSPAGSPPTAAQGAVGGDSFVFSPDRSYSAELKIFSGGTLSVGSIVGRHPHFTLTGGTVHYTGSRTFTLTSSLDGIFFLFNRDGYI
jgi:hypothetical protein